MQSDTNTDTWVLVPAEVDALKVDLGCLEPDPAKTKLCSLESQ